MSKINCGIVGYGNLGKSIEKILHSDENFNLVKVFSKRDIKAKYTDVENVQNLQKYKNKIDILFLCGGSSSNLTEQAYECLKNFNTIDAFDTHKKINSYIKNCNKLAIENNKVAFCCFGWDPGLFSLMRVLFNSLNKTTFTVWGKGVSQGHSEALRKIAGVKNAIQYTIPNKSAILKAKKGKLKNVQNLHKRLCFVVADDKDKKRIKNTILNMPNYFKGYNTIVKFINEKQMLKHQKLYHAGQVFTTDNTLNFNVKMDSNPNFTGQILVSYSKVLYTYIKQKKYGAYSILDIPISHLLKNSKEYI